MKLSESSEDQLISRITHHLIQREDVIVGPGDDCAVVRLDHGALQLLKTDCVVESVHYYPDEDAARVGWKAIARVVSDIAAMGGTPQSCVVTLVLRPDTSTDWLDALYRGMQACATAFELSIVGGETSSAPAGSANVISVAGTGSVDDHALVLRTTAQPGDILYVTGSLGGSLAGKHLDFTPRLREAQWLVQHFNPTAMMDLSDGLAKDLPRMAKLSSVSYQLELDNLPCSANSTVAQALGDGEDYELLFSISADMAAQLEASWPSEFAPLTRIGNCLDSDSPTRPDLSGGWEHFS